MCNSLGCSSYINVNNHANHFKIASRMVSAVKHLVGFFQFREVLGVNSLLDNSLGIQNGFLVMSLKQFIPII